MCKKQSKNNARSVSGHVSTVDIQTSADLSTLQNQVAELATYLAMHNSINASVQRVRVETNGRGKLPERVSSNDSSIKRSHGVVGSIPAPKPSIGDNGKSQ